MRWCKEKVSLWNLIEYSICDTLCVLQAATTKKNQFSQKGGRKRNRKFKKESPYYDVPTSFEKTLCYNYKRLRLLSFVFGFEVNEILTST